LELEEISMNTGNVALYAGALILIFMLYGCSSGSSNPPAPPPLAATDLVWDQGNWDEVNWN
jgi:hypothetical protein